MNHIVASLSAACQQIQKYSFKLRKIDELKEYNS